MSAAEIIEVNSQSGYSSASSERGADAPVARADRAGSHARRDYDSADEASGSESAYSDASYTGESESQESISAGESEGSQASESAEDVSDDESGSAEDDESAEDCESLDSFTPDLIENDASVSECDEPSSGGPGSDPSSDDGMRSLKRKKYAAEMRAGRAVLVHGQPRRCEANAAAVVVVVGYMAEDCRFLLLPTLAPADEVVLRFAGPPSIYPAEQVLRALTALGIRPARVGSAGYTTHRITWYTSFVPPETVKRMFVINCIPSLMVEE